MLKDITAVQPLDDYHLHLTFEDGMNGVVNVKEMVRFTGIFEPLTDPVYFNQVVVNEDIGTICWPNDVDLDPDVLYAAISGNAM